MLTRRLSFAALIAVVLSIQAIVSLDASAPESRMNYLSFNAATRLPGVGLGAGTYIFELAAPEGDQSIVRVSSRDRKIVYYMGFTELISRPAGMSPDRFVSFGEASPQTPMPITVWYPAGEPMGRRFIYRKATQ